MANYSYRKRVPQNAESWIDCLQIVNPTSAASASYSEIHFTQPKEAVAAAMAMPHVTFERNGSKTHWYLKPGNAKWTAELGGKNTDQALAGEGAIAQKVADDALALNFIKAPAAKTLVDDDGFQTVESKKGRHQRVQTSWKK